MNPLDPIEEAIFSAASALTSPPQRAAFLDQACGANVALRQRIEALLQADAHADQFFAADPLELGAETAEQTARPETRLTEAAGTRVGRYKLLQKIGEGGMGVVYMAEQEEPVRRRVALKIIKLGMDTRQVIARFEAERQALALMDHPNIARVFDGGATETGRPYFVMELVQGVPITEFCDKNRLPAKERLKLFIAVCQAIQSAHQKGIIHRDIKPSNVLVTLHDGVPVPKVIDFGIAKATHQKLTEKTLFTNFASMIGTPAYMSPEQAEMTGLDTDTRTDIYALGVLLYALLTGTTPFPEKRLRSLGYGEMQRIILEEEPERPSTRLSTMAHEQKTIIARNCGEEFASLSHLLKGDLDWIVMKCLEKDRQRRYETANGLATDIQRHLSNEPVIARPPSASYRFQKMIRRNRTAALTTAAVAVALILAAAFSTAAFVNERKARLQAAAAERAQEAARRATEVETVRADTVAKFVVDFFGSALPYLEQRGQYETIGHLFAVADRFATTLSNAPLAEAEIRLSVGNGYGAGDLSSAASRFLAAEKRALSGGPQGLHLANLARVGYLGATMWSHDDPGAVSKLSAFAKEVLLQSPPDSEVAAAALSDAAEFTAEFGSPAEAESLAREALRIAPDDDKHCSARIVALAVVAGALTKRGDTTQANEFGRKFLQNASKLSGDESSERMEFQYFSATLTSGSYYRPPVGLLQEALDSLPSADSPIGAILKGNLGVAIAQRGDWSRGLEILRQTGTNRVSPINLWHTATHLAALLGNEELRRSLCTYGLVRFAEGSDTGGSRLLAEALLICPPEQSSVFVIRELVTKSLKGPPWPRGWPQMQLSLMEYRTGQLAEASRVVSDYLREKQPTTKSKLDPFLACGLFLRACIEMRLEHLTAARDAYLEGQRVHSPALHSPGIPYDGDDWSAACQAELLRREAAALLGDATPPDAPTVTKP